MKKTVISLAATALALSVVLTGCGSADTASAVVSSAASGAESALSAVTSEAASVAETVAAEVDTATLSAIVDAVEAVNPVANPRDLDDFSLQNDMLLTMDNVAGYIGQISNDQANSALVLAVQALPGKADAVKAELESYKANQVAYYGNYAEFADAQSQIEQGIVESVGDLVVLVFPNTEGADLSAISGAVTAALG